MIANVRYFLLKVGVIVGGGILCGCVATQGGYSSSSKVSLLYEVENTQASYESVGNYWGKKLSLNNRKPATNLPNDYIRSICEIITQKDISEVQTAEVFKKNNITQNDIDVDFAYFLYNRNNPNYFEKNPELKDSFKKGFRLGYADRIADLVFGPHLNVTASCIGMSTSQDFVNVINEFESGWVSTLKNAINTFIVLISEGSQSDRENFIRQFVNIYGDKFNKTTALKAGGLMSQLSTGGTVLYIDMSKEAANAALDIPEPPALKKEIYKQTFKVMGDELGRRFSTNLIKRDELVDLMRRVKPVLSEVGADEYQTNLVIFENAFVEQYKADGNAVFRSIVLDAGYDLSVARAGNAINVSRR